MTRIERILAATLLTAALAISACSSDSASPSNDGGAADARSDAGDAGLTTCGYPVNGGCDAAAVCGLPVEVGNCAGALICACDGTNTTACKAPGYADKPIPVGSRYPCGWDAGSSDASDGSTDGADQ